MTLTWFRVIATILITTAILPAMASEEAVVSAEHWVQNGDIKIYVWEKYLG